MVNSIYDKFNGVIMEANHMKKIIKFLALLVLILPIFALTACSNNTLEGTYTGKISMIISTQTDKITFSKDKTFKENGDYKGTYEINGDKLTLNWNKNKAKMTAKLSKDRNSFVVESFNSKSTDSNFLLGNATQALEGTKYTKK